MEKMKLEEKNMMLVVKPPKKGTSNGVSIFLAGSIDMGTAEDWQSKVEESLKNLHCTIYNPRRDEWDSSWEQKQSQDQFNEQVNWEMNYLDSCDIIFMCLTKDSKAPISMLELGLHAASGKMIVVCPDEFWRKGNVEIVCTRYNIPMYSDLESGIGALKTKYQQIGRKRFFNI